MDDDFTFLISRDFGGRTNRFTLGGVVRRVAGSTRLPNRPTAISLNNMLLRHTCLSVEYRNFLFAYRTRGSEQPIYPTRVKDD